MEKIIAIDDNPIDNLINKILLEKTFPNHAITIFADSEEALDYLRAHKNDLPHFLVLDLNMPVVSGWEILEELSSYEKPCHVFLLTSSIFREDQVRAKQHPFVLDYFIKPLNSSMTEKMKTSLENYARM